MSRRTPANGRGRRRSPGPAEPDEPDLKTVLRTALASAHPLDLLAQLSSLVDAWDARHPNPMSVAELHAFVEVLTADDSPESTAALLLLATLLPDELTARRIARAVGGRAQGLPEWLQQLDQVAVRRTLRLSDSFGLAEQYWIEAVWPSGDTLSCGVLLHAVDGHVVGDAVVIPEGLDLVTQAQADTSAGSSLILDEVDPADLRARIDHAIQVSAERRSAPASDSWPAARPLVEWLLRKLPSGGQGFPPSDRTRDRRDTLGSFVADPYAPEPYPTFDPDEGYAGYGMRILAHRVGGRDALDALGAEPLPDEPFDWSVVTPAATPMVGSVLLLLDAFADEHADVEFRTACRRFLAQVAASDPRIFLRRSSPHTAAAAIAFGIGRANSMIGRRWLTGLDLADHFGLTAVPSSRLDTMARAIGLVDYGSYLPSLGDPGLLTSAERADIIESRDRYRAAIEAGER